MTNTVTVRQLHRFESYYSLNLAAGAQTQPRLWIANARILNADNQIEDERLFSRVLEDVVVFYKKKGLRIFCLALGDDRKVWGESTRRALPRKSWVARGSTSLPASMMSYSSLAARQYRFDRPFRVS